jgi:predicted amidohydrolase YtcJ
MMMFIVRLSAACAAVGFALLLGDAPVDSLDPRPFVNMGIAVTRRLPGTIEVGKSADSIVMDRDILKLADAGRAERILDTHVQKTWFVGQPVYVQNGT